MQMIKSIGERRCPGGGVSGSDPGLDGEFVLLGPRMVSGQQLRRYMSPVGDARHQHIGDTSVVLAAKALGNLAVGDLLGEGVLEHVARLALIPRLEQQLRRLKLIEVFGAVDQCARKKGVQQRRGYVATDDCGQRQDLAGAERKPVDPVSHERVHRCRQVTPRRRVGELQLTCFAGQSPERVSRANDLFDEQRSTVGLAEHLGLPSLEARIVPDEVIDHEARIRRSESIDPKARVVALRRPWIDELRAIGEHRDAWSASDLRRDGIDQMECRFVGPMKILEHDERGSLVVEKDVEDRGERAGPAELRVDDAPVVARTFWTKNGQKRWYVGGRTRPSMFEV